MVSMANDVKEEEISRTTIWGIPVGVMTYLLQKVGVPVLFMIFVCGLFGMYVPDMVKAHIVLLERTGDVLEQTAKTLEKMDATLKQSNILIQEVASVERDTKDFMDEVKDAHDKAQQDITVIKDTVTGKQ